MPENNESLYQRARDVGGRVNNWLDRPVFPGPHNSPAGGGFQGFARRFGSGAVQGAIPTRGEAILRGPNVPGQVLGSVVGGLYEGVSDAFRGSGWYQRMFGNGNDSTMGLEQNDSIKGPDSRFPTHPSGNRGGVPAYTQPGRMGTGPQRGTYIYPSTQPSGPSQGNFAWNPNLPVSPGSGKGPLRNGGNASGGTGSRGRGGGGAGGPGNRLGWTGATRIK